MKSKYNLETFVEYEVAPEHKENGVITGVIRRSAGYSYWVLESSSQTELEVKEKDITKAYRQVIARARLGRSMSDPQPQVPQQEAATGA